MGGVCARLPPEGGTAILALRVPPRLRPLLASWDFSALGRFLSLHGIAVAMATQLPGGALRSQGTGLASQINLPGSLNPLTCMETCTLMIGTLRCSQSSSPVTRLELRLRMYMCRVVGA